MAEKEKMMKCYYYLLIIIYLLPQREIVFIKTTLIRRFEWVLTIYNWAKIIQSSNAYPCSPHYPDIGGFFKEVHYTDLFPWCIWYLSQRKLIKVVPSTNSLSHYHLWLWRVMHYQAEAKTIHYIKVRHTRWSKWLISWIQRFLGRS